MAERIYLGRATNGYGPIYLSKHSWDCGWYWSFGYLGNKDCHFHFESYLEGDKYAVSDHLTMCNILQHEWWIIRDLFKQAYALQEAAAVYQYGGHQSTKAGVTDILKSPEKAAILNADLKIVLDKLWDFIGEAVKPKEEP